MISPASPRVSAAMGSTRTLAVAAARRMMKSTSEGSSITGSVLGMTIMVVTPPAAAASLADSRRFAMFAARLAGEDAAVDQAGRQHQPAAIDDFRIVGLGVVEQARADIGDPAIFDQQAALGVQARGRIDQPRIAEGDARSCASRLHAATRAQRIQHRHADGDAHLHLFLDQADFEIVGDVGGDFDAAVHRAGMHHQRARLGIGELFAVQAIEAEIFARRGHEGAGHALQLQPQHHHDVGAGQALRACR